MPCTSWLRPLALAVLVAAVAAPGWAQHGIASTSPLIVCELPVPDGAPGLGHEHRPGTASSSPDGEVPRAYVVTQGQSATFSVTYIGFPPEAEAAFQGAVDLWADLIQSSVPIEIEATWAELGPNVLGSAGPFLVRDFGGAPVSGTWYPTALANAITGSDVANGIDIEATFNSEFDRWYFGTDGNPGVSEVDLTTIVLHEIGHGLGFIGSLKASGTSGTYGLPSDNSNPRPFVYDREVVDDQGRSLLNSSLYPVGGSDLAFVLQDEVFLGGPQATRVFGALVPLHSPPTFIEGTSLSHLDEQEFMRGTPNGLMTPFLNNGEVLRSPGAVVCALFDDFGWPLGAACEALIPEGPPPVILPDVFELTLSRQLNGGAQTVLELTVEESQALTVLVFDAVGRRVSNQTDFADSGVPLDLMIEASDLPSGVYYVRIIGESFSTTTSFVRVR